MDAVKFLKERNRMCKSYSTCKGCPANGIECKYIYMMDTDFVSIVEKWSAEHPKKTRMQDLLEKYPKAKLAYGGCPEACTVDLGYCTECTMDDCLDCWNKPVEE